MAVTLNTNDFFTGLSNLALVVRLYATNTSRFTDNFVDSFATETLRNGDTKIFPFSDLPQVEDYSATSSITKVTKVPTNEETISISQRKVIPSSYSPWILGMAFTSDSGMNEFVGYIIGQMESAKTAYLYDRIITQLFGKTLTGAKQNHVVNLLNTTGITGASDLNSANTINQKRIATAIQDDVDNIQTYNSAYNAKGYTQALTVGDMRLIMCNPYKNENVVDLMAQLLRSEYITEAYDKPEMSFIPSIKIPDGKGDVIGWIMHKRFYQYFYAFEFMGKFVDESNLTINNFKHFWYGDGFLDNLPAIKLTANVAAPTVK